MKNKKNEKNKRKTKGGIWTQIGILSGVFLLALVVSSLLTNRGTADQTIESGGSDTAESFIFRGGSYGQHPCRICG